MQEIHQGRGLGGGGGRLGDLSLDMMSPHSQYSFLDLEAIQRHMSVHQHSASDPGKGGAPAAGNDSKRAGSVSSCLGRLSFLPSYLIWFNFVMKGSRPCRQALWWSGGAGGGRRESWKCVFWVDGKQRAEWAGHTSVFVQNASDSLSGCFILPVEPIYPRSPAFPLLTAQESL